MTSPATPHTPATPADAKALLDALAAEPRPAGSDAEARARRHAMALLAEAGFDVREVPFEYSTLPGRWATSIAGAASLLAVIAAGTLGLRGTPGLALATLVAAGALTGGFAGWAAVRGVLHAPWGRAGGTNVVATRGAPRVWMVAHLDSKSQPVSIFARAAGIVLIVVAWLALAALAAFAMRGAEPPAWAWVAATALGVAAALPILGSTVGARSPGALDDASGVAAVLLAARALPRDEPVGVLLPSAEELGLAGARAWASQRAVAPAIALNVDGVDDEGVTLVMTTRLARGVVPRAARALADAAGAEGVAARVRRLLPGLLVDAVALADAGWDAVTLSRGSVATLRRIHTPADHAGAVGGGGIALAARILARAVHATNREP